MENGLACIAIPYDGSFSLVGYADGCNVRCGASPFNQYIPGHVQLGVPYLLSIVLYPARFWENLIKLLLRYSLDTAIVIKQNGA